MELKKNKRKDLENKKVLFFEVGLAAALVLIFMAFEVRTAKRDMVFMPERELIVEPIIPVTVEMPPKPEPIPDNKRLAMLITDIIEINNDPNLPLIDIFIDPVMIDTSKYSRMARRTVEPEKDDPNEVFPIYNIQEKPTFQGKNANTFVNWVNSRIKYPEAAANNNVEGNVYLSFVIGKDGKLTDIKSISKLTDPMLVDEVIRVVKTSPDWEPGMQGIRKVNVSYQLPIRFKLQK